MRLPIGIVLDTFLIIFVHNTAAGHGRRRRTGGAARRRLSTRIGPLRLSKDREYTLTSTNSVRVLRLGRTGYQVGINIKYLDLSSFRAVKNQGSKLTRSENKLTYGLYFDTHNRQVSVSTNTESIARRHSAQDRDQDRDHSPRAPGGCQECLTPRGAEKHARSRYLCPFAEVGTLCAFGKSGRLSLRNWFEMPRLMRSDWKIVRYRNRKREEERNGEPGSGPKLRMGLGSNLDVGLSHRPGFFGYSVARVDTHFFRRAPAFNDTWQVTAAFSRLFRPAPACQLFIVMGKKL
ncbi:hypothetical protein EVAR_36397_1 [Eumeta japonica]|uniref:Uncharacterized protein n=1 Tax=Eumeta variegata TaxID=151549 RepID=A0A4C1W8C6_EUMVA|nr:hypothetical protein EVAR_36397_1 [Eumeta japonica]